MSCLMSGLFSGLTNYNFDHEAATDILISKVSLQMVLIRGRTVILKVP